MPSAQAKKAAPKTSPAKTAAKSAPKTNNAKADPEKTGVAKQPKAEKPPASTPTAGTTLRAKDLIARVAEVTGTKVKDIKLTVEATLSELGRALDAGEALNLPPLGRVKITPAKAEGSTQPMKLKLRRGTGNAGGGGQKNAAKETLAAADEES